MISPETNRPRILSASEAVIPKLNSKVRQDLSNIRNHITRNLMPLVCHQEQGLQVGTDRVMTNVEVIEATAQVLARTYGIDREDDIVQAFVNEEAVIVDREITLSESIPHIIRVVDDGIAIIDPHIDVPPLCERVTTDTDQAA